MGARLKKVALFLALALTLSTSTAYGATKKPTPKPTVKVSVKATPSVATKKATPKPKPKPKPKPRKKKKIKLSPSPKPKWPPAGFEYADGVYAKVPTSKQLVGVLSASGILASKIKECSQFVCGAVQVASEPGCVWWEVNSLVYSKEKVLLGKLRTINGPSEPQKVKTILLVSPEPIETLEYISDIEVICHQEPKPDDIQSSTYVEVTE
jgi:hypothetical protein